MSRVNWNVHCSHIKRSLWVRCLLLMFSSLLICTVGIKIIRAIFLWTDSQFKYLHAFYKHKKTRNHSTIERLEKYLFHKTALGMSSLSKNYRKCLNNFTVDCLRADAFPIGKSWKPVTSKFFDIMYLSCLISL